MYDEILVLSRRRHEQVKTAFFSGDIMEMDTVESYTRVQFWEQAALEADLGYYKKTQEVNQFLWTEDGKPLAMEERAHPVDEWPEKIFVNLRDSVMNISQNDQLREHPKLRSIEWGIAILKTEEQYSKELLKPKLDVNYNLLMGQPTTAYSLTPLDENYVFGVSFEFPLFLRKERSKLQLTRLKIQESQYKMDNTRWALITKMRQGLFALDNLEERYTLQRQQAENFRALYEGELINWQEGFSTQFVLNTREQRYLKATLEREQLALARLVAELNLGLAVAVFY
jgi:outer membrane protein TolC